MNGLHETNRNNVLQHIKKLAATRELSSSEKNIIDLMLDLGKPIPEILNILRSVKGKTTGLEHSIKPSQSLEVLYSEINVSERLQMSSPLERYFHEYLRR